MFLIKNGLVPASASTTVAATGSTPATITTATSSATAARPAPASWTSTTDILNTVLSDFADVKQPFGSGNDFDKCAKIRQPCDFAEIGLPYFGGCRQITNDLNRLVRRSLVIRSHINLAGILDIDLYTGLLDDRTDHLAARPNHVADLIDGNLEGVNAWGIGRHLVAVRGDDFIHLAEDVETPAL